MSQVLNIQFVANVLASGLTYALVALGIALIFSIMRVVNFAHGALYMVGAFVTYYTVVRFEQNYLLALLLSLALVGLLGFALEKAIFCRLRGAALQGMIVSLGVMLLLESTALLGFGQKMRGLEVFRGTISIAGGIIPVQKVFIIGMSLVLVAGLTCFIKYTKHGQATRALAQNRKAALLQGISVDRMSWMGFAIGSALAGVAGALLAPMVSVSYYMGGSVVLKAFMVIILGGLGSIPGAVVGGFILAVLENLGYAFFSGGWTTLITLTMVLVFLLVRPQGVMGREIEL